MFERVIRTCLIIGVVGMIVTSFIGGVTLLTLSMASAETVHNMDEKHDAYSYAYFGDGLTEKENKNELSFVKEQEANDHVSDENIVSLSNVEQREELYWNVIQSENINRDIVNDHVDISYDTPVIVSDTETNTFYVYEKTEPTYTFTAKGHVWWIFMLLFSFGLIGGAVLSMGHIGHNGVPNVGFDE